VRGVFIDTDIYNAGTGPPHAILRTTVVHGARDLAGAEVDYVYTAYGLGDDTTIRDCCNGLLLLQAGLCGGEPGHTAVGALAALARGDDDNVLDIEEVDRGHFNLDIGRSWRCAVATAVR
jgi:hypothetical protein